MSHHIHFLESECVSALIIRLWWSSSLQSLPVTYLFITWDEIEWSNTSRPLIKNQMLYRMIHDRLTKTPIELRGRTKTNNQTGGCISPASFAPDCKISHKNEYVQFRHFRINTYLAWLNWLEIEDISIRAQRYFLNFVAIFLIGRTLFEGQANR